MIKGSQNCTELIQHFEGCHLSSYIFPGESWATIGWGHAISLHEHPKKVSQIEADVLFLGDLVGREHELEKVIHPDIVKKMTQGMIDATLSFRYNAKPNDFNSSTFLRMLNAGEFAAAGNQLHRWVHGEGQKVLPGLVRRRKCEEYLFHGGSFDDLKLKYGFFITGHLTK